MPYFGTLGGMFSFRDPKFVRDGLGCRTGEGLRGGNPRVTHAATPGRTRAEKRATLKGARRAAIEYRRITGAYPSV